MSSNNRNYYAEHIAKGLCGFCDNPPEPGSKLCAVHREKQRQRAAARRMKRTANGLCLRFGCSAKAVSGRYCEKHAAENGASRKRCYAKRKAAGMCAVPGCTEAPKPGRVYCEKHSQATTKISSQRYHDHIAKGLCGYCDQPALPGQKRCQRHVDLAEDYRRSIRQRVIDGYGGQCKGCNRRELDLLAIDHIGGGGRRHFAENGLTSATFYRWLLDNNFPSGFRVLCRECNLKAARGIPLPNEITANKEQQTQRTKPCSTAPISTSNSPTAANSADSAETAE